MSDNSVIEFLLYENDEPLEIQLEPEAIIFKVMAGNSIRFVAKNCDPDFAWALRIEHKICGVQLFPDSRGNYDIEIYENDALLLDWYKYM